MRLIRNLREHKLAVLLVFVLLICQAFCDLSLPTLTSDIVDVGIQQSGIQHVATDQLSGRTYDIAAMLLDGEDAELLAASYDASDDGTYVLNEEGASRIDELDDAVAIPMIVAHADLSGYGIDLDEMLAAYQAGILADAEVEAISFQLEEQLAQAGDSLVQQQGISAASAEYEELGVDVSDIQMSYLLTTGAQMAALATLCMVFSILVGLVASRTGAKIGRDLRSRLFKRVMSFSEGDIDSFSAASLITRGTNDIQLIQNITIMLMRMVLYAPILAIGGIVMVTYTSPSMGWIIVVAIVAVLVVVVVLFAVAMPKFRIMQKLIDRVNLVAREILTGLPVVRAFQREKHEEKRFDAASLDLMRTQLFTNRVMAFMMPVMTLVMNATSVAIVWVGGHYIDAGTLQTGDMIAFITYAMVIIMGFLMLGMVSIMLPRANVAAGRIDEVLAFEPTIRDPLPESGKEIPAAPTGARQAQATPDEPVMPASAATEAATAGSFEDLRPRGARIAFEDVSFRYDEDSEDALHHVSFVAHPGQTLAIIGATGSGKSTVVKLIERFYDVNEGAITLDGTDIRQMSQSHLRAQLGYVPQKAFLFTGTVATNIAYGNEDMGQEDIRRALSIAQAVGFVDEREGGLDSDISQGGTNVSGGQRQRLAIARALATQARAFIFDDSFSALDYKTDAALRRGLQESLGGATLVIVAQRIATVMDADCIVVLDEGRVVGQGTHDQLMKECETYRAIALSQLSEEELAKGGDAA